MLALSQTPHPLTSVPDLADAENIDAVRKDRLEMKTHRMDVIFKHPHIYGHMVFGKQKQTIKGLYLTFKNRLNFFRIFQIRPTDKAS